MIEQLSTAVKFLAFYTEEKIGKTGLAVTVDVRGHDGSEIVTAGAATEIGDGLYSYTLSGGSTGNEGTYIAIFKTATDTVDQMHIPSLWCIGVAGVERLDADVSSRNATAPDNAGVAAIKAKTDNLPSDPADQSLVIAATDAIMAAIPAAGDVADAVWDEAIAGHGDAGSTGQALSAAGSAGDPLLNTVPGSYASGTAGHALGRIGSGQITTVSPVSQSGSVAIIRGDDYKAEDGRALEWTDASNSWPDLTDADISVIVNGVTYAGAVVTPTGASKKVRLELTYVQTTAMSTGTYRFAARATMDDDDILTLLSGSWRVKNPQDS
ncbi:MAG: hypothetical protein M9944_08115 [Rhizobiaceae bacterium]|nr:hypothetical protein [Rhizobiaceae bacterium]